MIIEYQSIIDNAINLIVAGAVAYFFWKFRQIDTHATKKELAEQHADLSEEIASVESLIPDDFITPTECGSCPGSNVDEFFTQHSKEEHDARENQTQSIMVRISEVKTDLGREIGEVKSRITEVKTDLGLEIGGIKVDIKENDKRFFNHITEESKLKAS
ncbi:MAG: hypothetical protein KAI64_04750 [Thermoplasmata archaeon]|nr:hypothetical protein [Thermoplasmata archaeon]